MDFFGFNTTLPGDEKRGGGRYDDEEYAYDALNDETFGANSKEVWDEALHENLSRIEGKIEGPAIPPQESDEEYDSDLDINFDRLKLDDCDIAIDDTDLYKIQLDPSVWTSPDNKYNKPLTPSHKTAAAANRNNYSEPDYGRQQNYQQTPTLAQQTNALQQLIGATPTATTKMMSLEDIERNLINQQLQQQQHKMIQEKLVAIQTKANLQTQQQHQQQALMKKMQQQAILGQPPPPMPNQPNNRQMNFPPHPLINSVQQPPPRLPPGFPAMPPHLQGGPPPPHMSRPLMPLPPNHPMNFMHQNYGGGPRPNNMPPNMQQQPRLMSHLFNMPPNQQGGPNNMNNMPPQTAAQFNQRLVQEIQQNHPMLAFNRNAPPPMFHNNHHMNGNNNNNNNHGHQQQQQRFQINGHMKMGDFDEYANLMSNRDKQFLITIQLMQLNTETPYFDDYYYTIYKERKKQKRGAENESQSYKNNTMNHPFTQPQGHAHMLLKHFGNFGNNTHNNNRGKNGMNNRERKNSESSTKNDQNKEPPTPRTYTPLQFENSLGKLQCGSVTAPRKIIDMEVVSAESGPQGPPNIELTTQRKSRQLLMHIESLYKVVLKLEDLQHPMAIAAMLIKKEKRDKERLIQLEQIKYEDELSGNSSGKSSISVNEPEGVAELMPKLVALLPADKITGMMTVRKGRNLLKRVLALIKQQPIRWDVWSAVFLSLTLMKKEKLEEIEDVLMLMYFEFCEQLQEAECKDVLKVSSTFALSPKLLSYINGCKFVVSSIIAIIIKTELIYQKSADYVNSCDQDEWIVFLNKLFEVTSTDPLIDAQILSSMNNNNVNRETDNVQVIKTAVAHFQRFRKELVFDYDKLIKILAIQYGVK